MKLIKRTETQFHLFLSLVLQRHPQITDVTELLNVANEYYSAFKLGPYDHDKFRNCLDEFLVNHKFARVTVAGRTYTLGGTAPRESSNAAKRYFNLFGTTTGNLWQQSNREKSDEISNDAKLYAQIGSAAVGLAAGWGTRVICQTFLPGIGDLAATGLGVAAGFCARKLALQRLTVAIDSLVNSDQLNFETVSEFVELSNYRRALAAA